ncbi:41381_t:CDS:1, partial [Gigaspora margarita]
EIYALFTPPYSENDIQNLLASLMGIKILEVMPIPQQLEMPTLKPIPSLTLHYLKTKITKYINYEQTSL